MKPVTLHFWQIILLSLVPIAILGEIWLAKNWRMLRDYANLLYRRSKCVLVRYHPTMGGIRERIVVPDANGVFPLYGGHHLYYPKYAVWNAKRRLHEIDIFEGEIVNGKYVLERAGGSTYASPHKQKTDNVFSSVEFDSLVRSQIVGAIAAATSREMRQLTLMYYVAFGTLIAVFLSMAFQWYLIDALKGDMENVLRALLNR